MVCALQSFDSKISATVLEFGEPLIAAMAEESVEALRSALQYVVTVWNAYALAMPEWGEKTEALVELARVRRRFETDGAPEQLLRLFDELAERRQQRYRDDWRAVGDWELVLDASGEPRFRCDARAPSGLTPAR